MILIISNKKDIHIEKVAWWLDQNNSKYIIFDPNIDSFEFSSEGLFFNIENLKVNIDQVISIWYRKPVTILFPNESLPKYFYQEYANKSNKILYEYLSKNKSVYMLNRFDDMSTAGNKILQLDLAKKIGLMTPITTITNNPKNIKIDDYQMVLKPLSGGNYFSEKGITLLGTKLITQKDIDNFEPKISNLPQIFQQKINKQFELRITIVGNQVFAVKIHSKKCEEDNIVDTRFVYKELYHTIFDLPQEIHDKLLILMKKLCLDYGAIDMIVDQNSNYYFLEINPNGQWLWLENMTNVPISKSIAEILMNPPVRV